jgi:hypothetical protein
MYLSKIHLYRIDSKQYLTSAQATINVLHIGDSCVVVEIIILLEQGAPGRQQGNQTSPRRFFPRPFFKLLRTTLRLSILINSDDTASALLLNSSTVTTKFLQHVPRALLGDYDIHLG